MIEGRIQGFAPAGECLEYVGEYREHTAKDFRANPPEADKNADSALRMNKPGMFCRKK